MWKCGNVETKHRLAHCEFPR
uniref:Uncharacterized protein n=1 Tax=Anguilla anguilla TaxID=7936 RepID=A0A0E9P5T8_ANGAN